MPGSARWMRRLAAALAGTSSEPERKTAGRHAGISKEQLIALLEKCGWNKAEVARALGMSHTAVWKYMKMWDIPLKRN